MRPVPAMTNRISRSEGGPLAIEEPLEIRLEYWAQDALRQKSLSITMRTPGHDVELAAGFLFTEGIIDSPEQIKQIRPCGPMVDGQDFQNIIRVELQRGVALDLPTLERNFYTTSSCGICGKTSLEALKVRSRYSPDIYMNRSHPLREAILYDLPERMKSQQILFERTGGCHASALFDMHGSLLCLREDVGRHNALDKVIGWAFMHGRLPLCETLVLVSGRASFELMQKAAMGGIPFLAAVGAPSSLALHAAQEFGMTLVGFLNSTRCTIYHDPGRIEQGSMRHEPTSRKVSRARRAAVGNSSRTS